MNSFPLAAPPFVGDSRRVPFGNAFEWLRSGWALFVAAPGVWVVIALIILIGNVLLALVPVLGQIASLVLTPLLAAGALKACRKVDEGGAPEIGDLFWGFRQRTSPLASLGLIYMAGFAVILVFAIIMVGGGAMLGAMFGGSSGPAAAIGGGAIAGVLAMVIAMIASVPLFMAIWFAPALVAFNEMRPVDAMRASFFASARNFGPITVFSLLFLVLAFFATLAAGLGWLVLLPVLFGALHASYRDVFPGA